MTFAQMMRSIARSASAIPTVRSVLRFTACPPVEDEARSVRRGGSPGVVEAEVEPVDRQADDATAVLRGDQIVQRAGRSALIERSVHMPRLDQRPARVQYFTLQDLSAQSQCLTATRVERDRVPALSGLDREGAINKHPIAI